MNGLFPQLDDWLSMPRETLVEQVAAHKLAMYVSTDGTRRHYLLNHPETDGKISDYTEYARFTGLAYVRLFDLLFSMGVHTVLTANLYPPNFQRGSESLDQMIAMSRRFLVNDPFTGLYERWQIQARLYGDYDLAPAAAPVRASLMALDSELASLATGRERLLLFGYCAGTFPDEMIRRTVHLQQILGRAPTSAELRLACFPHGPEHLDFFINTGWLRTGSVIHPTLDPGTDLYCLSRLAFDMTEPDLRRILYDHLFLRTAAPEDNLAYTVADLNALADYYAQPQAEFVIGLGQLVGPGIWYPQQSSSNR